VTPARARIPDGLAALRERNFLLYIVGHFVSQSGSSLEVAATSWILYDLTNSPVLLGLGGLCRAAPLLLLTLVGGAIADRFPRRPVLFVTETSQLLLNVIIAVLAASGLLAFWHLYLLSLLGGTLAAFSVPARQALFPGLVPRQAVASAVTLNAAASRTSSMLGPSIAGVALAASGYAAPFVVNAASYIGLSVALLAMRLPQTSAEAKQAAARSVRQALLEGLQFVRDNSILRTVVTLEVIGGLFGHNTALITIIARDRLGAGPEGLGLLLSSISAGALLTTLIVAALPTERRGMAIVVAGLAYSLLFFGFALSSSLILSAVALCLMGAADGVWGVNRNIVGQLVVPDRLRGRVMSVVTMTGRSCTMLGQIQSGSITALAGGPVAATIGAAVVTAGVLFSAVRAAELRAFKTSAAASKPKPR
jgi:MFS family permease